MAQAQNRYRADLRELSFVLFEQLELQSLMGREPFAAWSREEAEMVLREVQRFAYEVSGPLARIGDEQGCRLKDGQVKTPDGFRDAWRKLSEAGWAILAAHAEHGGQDAPLTLQCVADELISGSNTAFQMYAGLTLGAADLIASFGTPEQKALFCARMYSGQLAGTMCLTEPHAGSDVGDCSTAALPQPDGTYRIRGTKIFISGGDHDLTENIVHMVLARIEGAQKGTKGLSLFIVPKLRVEPDGSPGAPNDVLTASLEHKMGINGSATAVLSLGENDACQGLLCGTVPHQGIAQMFQMMNRARILVGVQGVGAASAAYLSALEYARERKQGASLAAARDPNAPRVPIVEHPDVRRMLLDMKARAEGVRLLGLTLAHHVDSVRALAGADPDVAAYHQGQVDLLTPIFKAYATDQGFLVAATAIQTYGGAGYLEDNPVEQHCRDAKIFSIYEGTNHIQALDLIGRKLRANQGRAPGELLARARRCAEVNAGDAALGRAATELGRAADSIEPTLAMLFAATRSGDLALPPLVANRVLEMFAELAVGLLLLEGAAIARRKLADLPAGDRDRAFYEGKVHAAVYYALNVVPGVRHKAEIVAAADRSALDIPDAAFATV
jgi:alkylation response protein AidB-like acyl-CoA dehydrogenase